jgi:hypothetical protein
LPIAPVKSRLSKTIRAVRHFYAMRIDWPHNPIPMGGKKFRTRECGTLCPETISYFGPCMFQIRFFHAMLCHTKVELSKIDLYYTRALEAKQNSGFSLN